jgi:hypothetical protein
MFVKTQLPSFDDLSYGLARPSALHRELARSQTQMIHINSVCAQGVDALSNLHALATFKSLHTLSGTALLAKAAELQGTVSPEQQLYLQQMNVGYLQSMATLQNVAAHQIIAQVAASTSCQVGKPSMVDRLLGR